VGTDLGIGVFAEIFDKELMDYATDPPPIIFEKLIASAPEAELPVADFEADVTTGNVPLTVHFTDKSTGNPTQWFWDFGDGKTSTEQNPVHTYNADDLFTVSLEVTNSAGSDTKYKYDYILVEPPDMGPFALTSGTYKDTDELEEAVKYELGDNYTVADWNDLKEYAQTHDIEQWANQIGLSGNTKTAWIKWNGAEFWENTSRHFFIERHDHQTPVFFLVHDDIDNNFIDLGSWYGMKVKILAKKMY
jgi:PKD repeat protein